MLVHRPRLKTQGAAVTTVAMLALGACTDPSARTDLRPEGPPDVLAVLVLNDALSGLIESATYCKPGDVKRPSLVGLPDFTTQQICPEAVADQPAKVTTASPELWYVRIMFDELLDPEIEELIPELDDNNQETGIYTGSLRNTQPVTLECQVASGDYAPVDYDGYYSPSGNNVTWPLGPSLVIKPTDPTIIPVETTCRVSLKGDIKDKSGTPVPEEQRGPFEFQIAPVQVIAISPEPKETINPEVGRIDLTFNVEIDASSIPLSAYVFDPPVANLGVRQYSGSGVYVYGEFLDNTAYTFSFAPDTQVKDKCEKASTLRGDNLKTNFKTTPLELVNIIPFQGDNAVPSRKIRINFNQVMDLATLVEGEDYEWVDNVKPDYPIVPGTNPPTPVAPFIYDAADPSVIIVNGVYKLDTNYKFKLKKGAKISDCPSKNVLINKPCPTTPSTRVITIAEDQLIDIRTAPAITSTAASIGAGTLTMAGAPSVRTAVTISGSGGQTIHKADEGERVFVRLDWNQDMDSSTLTTSEFTLTKADGTAVTIPTTPGFGTGSRTTLDMGALPAGNYKFTLKQNATLSDRLITSPNTYTQAADRVFTFIVEVDEETTFKCLGAP